MKPIYKIPLVFFIPLAIILYANSSGSIGGKTGSPGDGNSTCVECHTGTANATSGWITSNIPPSGYVPGETYQITATGVHTGVVRFGFELTAENTSGSKVGSFTITDAARTKLTNQGNAVTHTFNGTTVSGNSNSWSADWTAPGTDIGQIRFYAAFNAANGNGNTTGDVIYTSTLFVNAAQPASLLSVMPNEAEQGSNPSLTITGQNTSWSGSGPAVSLRNTANPNETIAASNVNVSTNTSLVAEFSIPAMASPGLWDVLVDDLVLASAFTVIEIIPALLSVVPAMADQGATIDMTITAENTNWSGSNPAVSLRNTANPNETFAAANVTVSNNTSLVANFSIPAMASPGLWDVLVDDLVLASAFTVIEIIPALLSVEPDMGAQGTTVDLTVSAENTFWVGDNPAVSLQFNGSLPTMIEATSVEIISNISLVASFDIPEEATLGLYNVVVDELVLVDAFTVTIYESIAEKNALAMKLYPNPATDHVFLELKEKATLRVFNTSGSLVLEQQLNAGRESISLSRLNKGTYILEVVTANARQSERLIVR